MKLNLISIEKQGFIRTSTEGSLTAADIDMSGKNAFETLLGAGWSTNRVLLNFSQTPYMDSCAIGWLIGTNRAFRDGGGKLVVHSIQPAVRQILDVLKVGKAISLAENEDAGRKLVLEDAAVVK